MKIIHKDATITPAGADDDFPGSFEVILSAPTLDRDGETLLAEDWKTPLPERITFDADHGMSVATTVGSGVPSIDELGNLVVSGTYSSLQRAQDVRTLVKEGHINTTSVAYMSDKTTKDGKATVKRELLNGAFVSVPANRDALVLSSKAASIKAGARNSATDATDIQSIHDMASKLGAACATKAVSGATIKSVVGSLEATQDRARDALSDAYPGAYVWLRATLPAVLVFTVEDQDTYDCEEFQQSYTDDGKVVTLTGEPSAVDVMEVITPDPDENAEPAAEQAAAAAGQPAAAAAGKAAEQADSDAVTAKALQIIADSFVTDIPQEE